MPSPKKKKTRNLKRARVESPKARSTPGPAARPVVQHEFLVQGNVRLFTDGEGDSERVDRTDASTDNKTATANSAWVAVMAVMAGSGFKGRGSTELIRRRLDLVDALLPNATVQFAIRVAPPVHNSQTRVGDAEILNSNPKDERRQEERRSSEQVGHQVQVMEEEEDNRDGFNRLEEQDELSPPVEPEDYKTLTTTTKSPGP